MGLLDWLNGRLGGGGSPPDAPSAPDLAAPARPSAPAWRELPPVQRALSSPGLVSDPAGFRSGLSAWQDASFREPLGHLVSPDAPSGLGHGLTGSLSVNREAEETASGEVASAGRETDGGTSRRSSTWVPLQRDADTAALTSARPLVSSLEDMPRLTVAEPPGTPPPSEGPRQGATSPVPPSAPVQRSTESGLPPVQRSTPSTAPAAPRPRSLGLGEPLHSLPPTAQRSTPVTGPAPEVTPSEAPAIDGAPDSSAPPPSEVAAAPPSRPLLGDDPLTTVSRTAEGPEDVGTATSGGGRPEGSVPAAPPAAAHTPVPLQRAAEDGSPLPPRPAPALEALAPLVAQRSVPLYSRAALDATEASPDSADEQAVPVTWEAPEPPGSSPRSRPAPSGTDGGTGGSGYGPETPASPPPTAPVQRLAATADAPAPLRRHPVSPPQVQRSAAGTRPAGSLPGPGPAPGPALSRSAPSLPDAGAAAVAAGVAQRMTDGSVVFSPPTVQRDDEFGSGTSDSGGAPPPDTPADDPDMEPEPEAPPTGGDSTGGPGASGQDRPEGKDGAPKVTDELVRALFAPLSRMLKAELRLDRERAGFLIDTRH